MLSFYRRLPRSQREVFSTFGLIIAVLALSIVSALAQVPASVPPYNTIQSTLFSNTLATVPGTYNSPQQINLDGTGVYCTLNVTASSGAPTTVFAIQGYDAASATYQTIVASGTVTPSGTTPLQNIIEVAPAIAVSSLPTGVLAAVNLKMPRLWRLQEVLAGTTGPAQASTIDCAKFK